MGFQSRICKGTYIPFLYKTTHKVCALETYISIQQILLNIYQSQQWLLAVPSRKVAFMFSFLQDIGSVPFSEVLFIVLQNSLEMFVVYWWIQAVALQFLHRGRCGQGCTYNVIKHYLGVYDFLSFCDLALFTLSLTILFIHTYSASKNEKKLKIMTLCHHFQRCHQRL